MEARNRHFKTGEATKLTWSIAASVIFHVLVFAFCATTSVFYPLTGHAEKFEFVWLASSSLPSEGPDLPNVTQTISEESNGAANNRSEHTGEATPDEPADNPGAPDIPLSPTDMDDITAIAAVDKTKEFRAPPASKENKAVPSRAKKNEPLPEENDKTYPPEKGLVAATSSNLRRDEEAERAREEAERLVGEKTALEQRKKEELLAKKLEQERLAAEQAERERIIREQATRDRLAAEKTELERIAAAQKAALEQQARENARLERLATERAERERTAREQATRDRLAAEKAEQERITAAQKAALEQQAQENARLERLAAERAERERTAREQAARDRLAAEKIEQERMAAAQKAALEQQARERARLERLAAERAERERTAREQAARDRLAAEKAIQERKVAAQKAALEQQAREKARLERLAAERAERERIAREQATRDRLAAEKAVQEQKTAAQKRALEQQALEKARLERLAAERAERERIAREQAARDRLSAEKAVQERKAAAQKTVLEQQAREKARLERLAAEQTERERLAMNSQSVVRPVLKPDTSAGNTGKPAPGTTARQTIPERTEEREKLQAAKVAPEAVQPILPPVYGDLKMVVDAEKDLKISILFREFPKTRRSRPMSRSEATRTRKIEPIVLKTVKNSREMIVKTAGEGIYLFLAETAAGETDRGAFTLKLFESTAVARVKTIGNRTIAGKTVIARVLMPEGILWEDDSAFSGSFEDSDSTTKFNTDTGLTWKEYKN